MLTFHKIIAGCEEGQEESWLAFLADYTPLALQLTTVYMPGMADPLGLWRESVIKLCDSGFQKLRVFSRQSEREFLLDLRDFLFECGSMSLDSIDTPEVTLETVGELLRGLPFMHQEMLLLKLAGYSDSTLEQIFRVTPAVAAKSLERLTGSCAALGQPDTQVLRPIARLKLRRELKAARKESCTPVRQLVRIQDGQLGWYDKDPVEQHLAECLSCLECWAALRELSYWRRAAQPVPATDLETLLSAIPITRHARKPKSIMQRLWG